MTASDYTNRSFEVAGGTSGEVATTNLQPFGLSAWDTLEIRADGGDIQTVRMDPAEFADISNATSIEVRAIIRAQTVGVDTPIFGSRVKVASLSAGASSSIEVVGGTANTALNFPSGVYNGTTQLGYADSWVVSSVGSSIEFGDFTHEFAEPLDSFSYGWPTSPVTPPGNQTQDYLFALDPDSIEVASFDPGAKTEEDFEQLWGNTSTDLGALENGNFADDGSPVFETFGGDWPASPGPPGNQAKDFVTSLVTVEAGSFNPVTGPDTYDGFETEWRDNQDFKTEFGGGDLDSAEFTLPADSTLTEKFGDDVYIPEQWIVVFTSDPPPTGNYRVTINGAVFETTGNGALSKVTLTTDLRDKINNSGIAVSASLNPNDDLLFGDDNFQELLVQGIVLTAPPSEMVTRRAVEDAYGIGQWTGTGTLQTGP